jgi:hypothetical protein
MLIFVKTKTHTIMKKNTILGIALSTVAVGLLVVSSAFTPKGNHLKITNKTDSRIDEVHFDDSGDILDDDEVLEPGESVEVSFDCKGVSADDKTKITLVFVDGKTFAFDDEVCDGDFAWDIVNDGH